MTSLINTYRFASKMSGQYAIKNEFHCIDCSPQFNFYQRDNYLIRAITQILSEQSGKDSIQGFSSKWLQTISFHTQGPFKIPTSRVDKSFSFFIYIRTGSISISYTQTLNSFEYFEHSFINGRYRYLILLETSQ